MPALEAAEEAALEAAGLRRDELMQHPRVPPLVAGHRGAGGLGLLRVGVLVDSFLRRDRRKDQVGAEAPRQGRKHPAPPRGSPGRHRRAGTPQAVLPEADVPLFHRRQVGVDLRQPGIGLAGRHRAILRRAVDFVLPVLEVAPRVRRVRHGRTDHTTLFPIWVSAKSNPAIMSRPERRSGALSRRFIACAFMRSHLWWSPCS